MPIAEATELTKLLTQYGWPALCVVLMGVCVFLFRWGRDGQAALHAKYADQLADLHRRIELEKDRHLESVQKLAPIMDRVVALMDYIARQVQIGRIKGPPP